MRFLRRSWHSIAMTSTVLLLGLLTLMVHNQVSNQTAGIAIMILGVVSVLLAVLRDHPIRRHNNR
jgi:hypothetical protein